VSPDPLMGTLCATTAMRTVLSAAAVLLAVGCSTEAHLWRDEGHHQLE